MVFKSLKSALGNRSNSNGPINLPPVPTLDIETLPEKRSRTLKHLIKANHATKSIIGKDGEPNDISIHLGAAYLLGASAAELIETYDEFEPQQSKWMDSPSEISDWLEFLGDPSYQRAYIDYFEDQLVQFSYDWRAMILFYLFEGEKPLIYTLIAGNPQSLIHLAYAFELSSQTLAIEALAMTCCFPDIQSKYITERKYHTRNSDFSTKSPTEIIREIATDHRLNNCSKANIFEDHEEIVLEYWNALELTDLTTQFEEMQRLAVALAVNPRKHLSPDYPSGTLLLHSSRAVRVLIPIIPPKFRIPLIGQWWLLAITTYICNGRKPLEMDPITSKDAKNKTWEEVQSTLRTRGLRDAYYLGDAVSLSQAAETWGDNDRFYLKAGILYGEE